MTKKPFLYTICAVLVGYFLISVIPGQVFIYSGSDRFMVEETPQLEEGDEVGLKENDSGYNVLGNESSNDFTETGEPKPIQRRGENLVSLYGWWIVDLSIAIMIYFLARRILT